MLRGLVLFAVIAQQPLAFEAASVKPNHSGGGDSSYNTHPASLDMKNVPLTTCIEAAYNLRPGQLLGPSWLESERFDIVARAAGKVSDGELIQMLQNLLAERFKLAVHREERQLPSYALLVDKGGLKIKPVEGTRNSTHTVRGTFTATEAPLALFAANLDRILGSPVLDETRTPGVFTFTLTWVPDEKTATGPTIFEAIREQLGLKLEARKTPFDVVVVDHVERAPTEN